jgi:hypothetical protein
VKNRFQILPFKCNLQRYITASAHTRQINPIGRLLATALTLGGLATYSMVTSTLSVTLRGGRPCTS